MERNQTYYSYIEYIFDYFSKMGCHAGQGGFILRGIDDRARKAGYSQEQTRIIKMLIFNLIENEYLEASEDLFVKLTELGYAFLQDGEIEIGRIDLTQYVQLQDKDFYNLWLLIGKDDIAPFYITGPEYYKVVQPFIPNMPVTYSAYMDELKDKDARLTSRVIWYERLWKQIALENRSSFLADLSLVIQQKYSKAEIKLEINTKEIQLDMEKKPLLFISHASADKEFATALVTLLEQQGFTHEHMFCSSVDGYGFDVGDDIYNGLLKSFMTITCLYCLCIRLGSMHAPLR